MFQNPNTFFFILWKLEKILNDIVTRNLFLESWVYVFFVENPGVLNGPSNDRFITTNGPFFNGPLNDRYVIKELTTENGR